MDPRKNFRCPSCGTIVNDTQRPYGAASPCQQCLFDRILVIDSPDFPYLNYGGAEFSTIVYTFDVDKESTLYKFMESRLRYAPFKIEIRHDRCVNCDQLIHNERNDWCKKYQVVLLHMNKKAMKCIACRREESDEKGNG